MIDDRCAIKRCKQEAWLTVCGVKMCQKHWEALCDSQHQEHLVQLDDDEEDAVKTMMRERERYG